MEQEIIKRHNFDKAVRKIQNFAANVPVVPSLKTVRENGRFWGFTEHHVTGEEMNDQVNNINKIFIKQNQLIISTIKEFNDVYKTFDLLDKEYIQGIVAALSSVKVALKNNSQTQQDLSRSQTDISNSQADIKRVQETIQSTLTALRKTVEILTQFKRQTAEELEQMRETLSFIQSKTSQMDEQTLQTQCIARKCEELEWGMAQIKEFANVERLKELILYLDSFAQNTREALRKHDRQFSEAQVREEYLESCMRESVESIDQRISALRNRLEEGLRTLESDLSELGRTTRLKAAELERLQRQHKSEIEERLDQQRCFGEALEARLHTLQTSLEIRMTHDKAALEQSLSSLQASLEEKTHTLTEEQARHKAESDQKTEDLLQQLQAANRLSDKKFKWAYGVAVLSWIINMILILLHIMEIL